MPWFLFSFANLIHWWGKCFCLHLYKTFCESTLKETLFKNRLNMSCRHLKGFSFFPTVHLWRTKLWLWFVVRLFAASNLSPMHCFDDESSAVHQPATPISCEAPYHFFFFLYYCFKILVLKSSMCLPGKPVNKCSL